MFLFPEPRPLNIWGSRVDTRKAAYIRRLIAQEPGGRDVLALLRSRPDILWQAWMADLSVQAIPYVVKAMLKIPCIWWTRGNSLELAQKVSGAEAEHTEGVGKGTNEGKRAAPQGLGDGRGSAQQSQPGARVPTGGEPPARDRPGHRWTGFASRNRVGPAEAVTPLLA